MQLNHISAKCQTWECRSGTRNRNEGNPTERAITQGWQVCQF